MYDAALTKLVTRTLFPETIELATPIPPFTTRAPVETLVDCALDNTQTSVWLVNTTSAVPSGSK